MNALWTSTNPLTLPHYCWSLNHIFVDEKSFRIDKMLSPIRGNSLTCLCNASIYCTLCTVTALNPLTDEYLGGGCPSEGLSLIPVWVQTAFTRVSVACTSSRLKHVTTARAPKDATKTVTTAWKDGFSTVQEVHKAYPSVGVQCLRRCSDITCRGFPSKVCGWSGQKWMTGVYVVHIHHSSNWYTPRTMVLLWWVSRSVVVWGLFLVVLKSAFF